MHCLKTGILHGCLFLIIPLYIISHLCVFIELLGSPPYQKSSCLPGPAPFSICCLSKFTYHYIDAVSNKCYIPNIERDGKSKWLLAVHFYIPLSNTTTIFQDRKIFYKKGLKNECDLYRIGVYCFFIRFYSSSSMIV